MSGSKLWAEYLDLHFPVEGDGPPPMIRASAEDCAKIIHEYVLTFIEVFEIIGPHEVPAATSDAVWEVDRALEQVVMDGNLDAFVQLSVDGLYELMDRLTWSESALVLEEGAASGWSLPLPTDAPDDVQEIATLLAVLAGPGRDCPPEWRLERKPWRRAEA